MGRLIRKKTPRKKRSAGPEASMQDGGAVPAAEPRKFAPAGDGQKRTGLLQKKASPAVDKDSYIGKAVQFLREVKAELKKVVWPSRKQTMGSTLVVIVLVFIISAFLGLVDMGLSNVIRLVLN